jgi:hypothetical protein
LRKRRLGCHAGGCRCGNDALVGCAMMSCLPCLPPHFTCTRSRYRADTEPLLHLWQDTAAGVEPQLAACQVCRHLRVGRKQGDVARSCSLLMDKSHQSPKRLTWFHPAPHSRRGRREGSLYGDGQSKKTPHRGEPGQSTGTVCSPGVLPVQCVPAPPVNEPRLFRAFAIWVLIPRVRCLIRSPIGSRQTKRLRQETPNWKRQINA